MEARKGAVVIVVVVVNVEIIIGGACLGTITELSRTRVGGRLSVGGSRGGSRGGSGVVAWRGSERDVIDQQPFLDRFMSIVSLHHFTHARIRCDESFRKRIEVFAVEDCWDIVVLWQGDPAALGKDLILFEFRNKPRHNI